MKKVFFFIPTLQIGGIENVFITFANYLCNKYEVGFILCKRGGILENMLSPKIKVYDLGGIKLRSAIIPLVKFIRQFLPDFIMTGSDKANTILTIANKIAHNKTKVIISQHNYYNLETRKDGILSVLNEKLIRFVYPQADKIIAISEGIKNYLIKDIGVPNSKVTLLNNPIDIDLTIQRSNEAIEDLGGFFVFVGRLSPVKNLNFLIESFKQADFKSIKLVIIGDGPERKSLLKISDNPNIFFTGAKSNPLPYIKKAKALILPSFSEAFPTVLLESMTLNTRVIATPTKGASEILEDVRSAILLKSFTDKQEMISALKEVNKNWQVDTLSFATKYDVRKICEKLELILKDIK